GPSFVVKLDSEKNSIVDLGPADQYDSTPEKGQQISVKGAVYTTGDKSILLATNVTCNGNEQDVDRSGRVFKGTIADLTTVEVRGSKHQFARIKTDQGKKLLADLGPQSKLSLELQKGSQVTIKGVAVKVKDRLLLIARELTSNGNSEDIQQVALQ
ncbi:MAG: hypothetical protein KDA94_17310, partial [Acidimicrobiales bacterium]|nr:hypothetical protein [Acidimicrobiales bacterium]